MSKAANWCGPSCRSPTGMTLPGPAAPRDCFNFESHLKPLDGPKLQLTFSTSDGTEWTLTEEWLLSQSKPRSPLHRLVFTQESHYDRQYSIDMEVMSAHNRTSGKLQVSVLTYHTLTKIVIPISRYEMFQYSTGRKTKDFHGVALPARLFDETFRYRVVLSRARTGEPAPAARSGDRLLAFSDQLLSLLDTGACSDVLLVAGPARLRAHRAVLSARSPVFRAMFRYDQLESRRGVVLLPEAEAGALPELLRFLYSGLLRPVGADAAEELYVLADKYFVEGLKEECSRVLQRHVTTRNYSYFKALGRRFRDRSLLRAAVLRKACKAWLGKRARIRMQHMPYQSFSDLNSLRRILEERMLNLRPSVI